MLEGWLASWRQADHQNQPNNMNNSTRKQNSYKNYFKNVLKATCLAKRRIFVESFEPPEATHQRSRTIFYWDTYIFLQKDVFFFSLSNRRRQRTNGAGRFLRIILSNPILSYPILSYPILSYPILSNPILSYPIQSYPILSYHILSHTLRC